MCKKLTGIFNDKLGSFVNENTYSDCVLDILRDIYLHKDTTIIPNNT